MKKIWHILQDHWKADFSLPYYACIGIFLAINLVVNAQFDWESKIDFYQGSYFRLIGYFLLYGFAYFGGLLIMTVFKPDVRARLTPRFWTLSTLGLLVLSVDSGFPWLGQWVAAFQNDYRIYGWLYSVTNDAIGFLFVFLPLFLIYPFIPNRSDERYGLNPPKYDFKPYFFLLLLMVPLIAGASFTEGFSAYYPSYKSNMASEALGIAPWATMATYEFFYGLDFFNVELLFRGFMIVGLGQLLGKHAIMPMVTTYCFLHFGKPTGEAISSICGGYILGVLAFYTRGIWGGVIIHMGIAWLMELAAYLQKIKT